MLNRKLVDDLCQKLSSALPEGLKDSREKCCAQFRSILQTSFEKLDLVTKEDFDRQAKHLQELQKKLAELEEKLNKLKN